MFFFFFVSQICDKEINPEFHPVEKLCYQNHGDKVCDLTLSV